MSATKPYWGKRNRRSISTRLFNKQEPVYKQSFRLTFPELVVKTMRRGGSFRIFENKEMWQVVVSLFGPGLCYIRQLFYIPLR